MARKKRRKEKTQAGSQADSSFPPAFDSARGAPEESPEEFEEHGEFVPRRDADLRENLTGAPEAAADVKGQVLASPPERELREFNDTSRKPEGFFGRISRWFQGESQPLVPPPLITPPPQRRRDLGPIPMGPSPERIAPPPPQRESSSPPAAKPASSDPATPVTPSKVDHVLAVLTLERVLPELDAVRKELEEMKLSSTHRIRQLEAERDQLRVELEASRVAARGPARETAEPEDHREEARRLEEQLAEARRTAEERIRQLQSERDQSRSEADRASAAQDDLNLRIRKLEATLDVQKGDDSEELGSLRSRIQAMQEELEAARLHSQREKEAAQSRIEQVEAERDRMSATLAAKERKLVAAMEQIEEVQEQAQRLAAEMAQIHKLRAERDQLSSQLAAKEDELLTSSKLAERVRELETELTDWKDRAATLSSTLSQTQAVAAAAPARSAASSAAPADPNAATSEIGAARLADLYQQTMSRLTVIQASAELLAMNSRLDASSRDTAKDIRTESQLLSEIIKSFALPPDMRRAE